MMKSMVSDSKESEELIKGYNKHIAIIETITKRVRDDFKQKKKDKEKTRKERLEENRVRSKPAFTKLTSPKRKYQRKKKETPHIIPEEFMIKPSEPEPELPDPSLDEIRLEYRKYRATLEPEPPIEITPKMTEKKKNVLYDIETFQDPVEVQLFLRQRMQLREFMLENPYEHITYYSFYGFSIEHSQR
jgi:hypothetical protein